MLRELHTTEPYVPIGFAGDSVVIAEGTEGAYTVAIWDRDGRATEIEDVAKKPTLDPSGRFLTVILDDHTIKTRDLVDRERPDTAFVRRRAATGSASRSDGLAVDRCRATRDFGGRARRR